MGLPSLNLKAKQIRISHLLKWFVKKNAPAGIRTRVGSSGGSQDIHYPTRADIRHMDVSPYEQDVKEYNNYGIGISGNKFSSFEISRKNGGVRFFDLPGRIRDIRILTGNIWEMLTIGDYGYLSL